MLVLGGILRIEREQQNSGGCNRSLPALRALDLTTFKWSDRWNGSPEPYSVPDAVTRVIGGNGGGGATMKQPNGGFNDSALNSVFAAVAARYTPIATRQSDSGGSPPISNGGYSPARRTNTGAIAGWVVGGIALLALILAVIFMLIRRRKRGGKPSPLHHPPGHAWDDKPQEMSNDTQTQRFRPGGSYQPVTQEMDGGYQGNEVTGDPRRPVGELPG